MLVLHPGPKKARGSMMSAESRAVSLSISLMKGFMVDSHHCDRLTPRQASNVA